MVFTQKVLRTEVLRAEGFTHNIFYIQTFLDIDAFTRKTDCIRHVFTRKQFLHREVLFPLLHHPPFVFPLSSPYGNTVLDDPAATLSAYNLETGCSLTMVVENPGPNILHATINDRHDSTDSCYLGEAARSKEFVHPVSSIKISARTFLDQDHRYA